jgi:hypothetical protein
MIALFSVHFGGGIVLQGYPELTQLVIFIFHVGGLAILFVEGMYLAGRTFVDRERVNYTRGAAVTLALSMLMLMVELFIAT